MYLFLLLSIIISLTTLSRAAPRPHNLATICSESAATSSYTRTYAAEPSESRDDCASGGLCDCSRIADKNGDEYFQCVTNPNCEHCWVSRTTTTTSSTTTTTTSKSTPNAPIANSTRFAATNYHTMSPGTYTITTNGTVLNIVVTQEFVTPSSTQVYVTMTQTVVVTVQPGAQTAKDSPARTATGIGASSTAETDGSCKGRCDCSKVEDKESREFFECLTNPDCEQCHSTHGAAAATETFSASSTTAPSTTVGSTTTTSSSATPIETCPQFCDCSSIGDKESEDYFQCVTNPVCERCNTGG